MNISLKLFLFGLLIAFGCSVNAQSLSQKTDSSGVKTADNSTIKDLDTEESLKYMGNELLFELKKRLHISTEEEEKKEEKPDEKIRFNLFGLRIEKN